MKRDSRPEPSSPILHGNSLSEFYIVRHDDAVMRIAGVCFAKSQPVRVECMTVKGLQIPHFRTCLELQAAAATAHQL